MNIDVLVHTIIKELETSKEIAPIGPWSAGWNAALKAAIVIVRGVFGQSLFREEIKSKTELNIIVRVRPPYIIIGRAGASGAIVIEYMNREGGWIKIKEGDMLPEQCYHLYTMGSVLPVDYFSQYYIHC